MRGKTFIVSALTGLLFSPSLSAQTSQSVVSPVTVPFSTEYFTEGTSEITRAELTQEKIYNFVTAAVAADKVLRQWNPMIKNAPTPEQANFLQKQANARYSDAIDATEGITVEEYKQISRAARNNPLLKAQINNLYSQRVGK